MSSKNEGRNRRRTEFGPRLVAGCLQNRGTESRHSHNGMSEALGCDPTLKATLEIELTPTSRKSEKIYALTSFFDLQHRQDSELYHDKWFEQIRILNFREPV